jgi:hypothetical protein
MADLHDLIRDELSVGDDSYFLSPDAMRAAIEAVLELHHPFGIYDKCGHDHAEADSGVREIHNVGLVCDEGLEFVVCSHCCASDGYGQSEQCASEHDHGRSCDPCPTVRLIAEKLDLIVEAAA